MTLEQVFMNLKKDIYKAVYSRGTLKLIGKLMTGKIKQRTRTGFGTNRKDGVNEVKLRPLKPSYIKQRRSLQSKGKLSSETSPEMSNLTNTGKMLNDLTFETNPNGVTIKLATPESTVKASHSNSRGARYFLFATKQDKEQIAQLIKERIINALKR